MEVHGDMNKTKKKDKATVTRSASSSKRDSHKAPAAPRSVDGKIPNGPERIVYGSKEMEAAANLWNTDPVAAFKEYFRLLADNPSEDAQERLNDFFGFLKDEIKLHPDKIVATDKRLNKAERDDVLARQKAHRKAMQPDQRKAKQAVLFREEAAGLDFLVEAAREDGIPLDWRALEKHFYNLEMAFDPSFYNTGVGEMTGSPDDIQIKRDAIIASRQTKMAQALFALNPTRANQHADALRTIPAPPGSAPVEKRTPFLREIERLESRAGASSTSALPCTLNFQVIDPNWQCVRAKTSLFELKGRKQIIKVLRFLWQKHFTSATGKRGSVEAVCRAAGQKAKTPNLHSIFHVMKAKSPNLNYDILYDLAIDNERKLGVLLRV
jgi:hypothetical protein